MLNQGGNHKASTLGSEHALQTRPEGLAHLADIVLPHSGPRAVDKGLGLIHTAVPDLAGLSLNMRQHAIVKGVEVRLWLPPVFWPEIHV